MKEKSKEECKWKETFDGKIFCYYKKELECKDCEFKELKEAKK